MKVVKLLKYVLTLILPFQPLHLFHSFSLFLSLSVPLHSLFLSDFIHVAPLSFNFSIAHTLFTNYLFFVTFFYFIYSPTYYSSSFLLFCVNHNWLFTLFLPIYSNCRCTDFTMNVFVNTETEQCGNYSPICLIICHWRQL